jgi:membrane-associated PAP2 superfamily phosphatase
MSSNIHVAAIFREQCRLMSPGEATPTPNKIRRPNRPPILRPILFLILLSGLVRLGNLDRALQREFWSSESGWRLANHPLVEYLYTYGTWPALIVAGLGLAVWCASLWAARLRPVGLFGGFLAVAMMVGPGLVVNSVFKEHFGRPRPKNTLEFGGSAEFHALGVPVLGGSGKSFPSGHASTGFFWFAPCIFFWQRHRRLALGFAALGVVHGGLMSLGRMAQGAHWFSDNLWAAGFVYIVSWLLHCWLVGHGGARSGNAEGVLAALAGVRRYLKTGSGRALTMERGSPREAAATGEACRATMDEGTVSAGFGAKRSRFSGAGHTARLPE